MKDKLFTGLLVLGVLLVVAVPVSYGIFKAYYTVKQCGVAGLFVECRIESSK